MTGELAVISGLVGFGLMYTGARVLRWMEMRDPAYPDWPEIVTKNMPEYDEVRQAMIEILKKPWTFRDLDKLVDESHPYKPFQGHLMFPKLPKPFSCESLHIVGSSGGGLIFFCARAGCLCAPVRKDFEGDYPTYCPEDEFYGLRALEDDAWDYDDYDDYLDFPDDDEEYYLEEADPQDDVWEMV